MGVWIETFVLLVLDLPKRVTPFVGVWIETTPILIERSKYLSHPSWVCGLKQLGSIRR